MTPFQYARANDVADAIKQIAADPSAKFIAGGTNLIDLIKYDVERPARLIDISHLPLKSVEETAGRRRSDRGAGAELRPRLPPADRTTLSAAGARDPGGRVAAVAQHGLDRRQSRCSARAASISTTPRRPATNASRAAAARRSTASTASMRSSERANPASRRIPPTCAWRSQRSKPTCMSQARPARAPSRLRISIGCPATRRSATPIWSPTRSSRPSSFRRKVLARTIPT